MSNGMSASHWILKLKVHKFDHCLLVWKHVQIGKARILFAQYCTRHLSHNLQHYARIHGQDVFLMILFVKSCCFHCRHVLYLLCLHGLISKQSKCKTNYAWISSPGNAYITACPKSRPSIYTNGNTFFFGEGDCVLLDNALWVLVVSH